MRVIRRGGWLVLVACMAVSVGFCQAAGKRPPIKKNQWHFTAENDGPHPKVEIPDAVLRSISHDHWVRDRLDGAKPPLKEVPRSWLLGTKVRLKGPGEDDIVVQGTGWLQGANITTFWIFRVHGDKAKLLLEISAHDLFVGSRRKDGYLTVEADSLTATTISTVWLRMKNGKYVEYREKLRRLGNR